MIPGNLLLAQTQEVMLTLDLAGYLTWLNRAAEHLFGCSEAELLGKPFSTVLDPYSHAKAALMLAQTLAHGSVTDWELDHVQREGPPLLFGYTTTLLRNETQEVIGIGALGHDLSAKLELTARLAETNQQLEGTLLQLERTHAELKATQVQLVQSEKMRSLGQMVAGVAHEINNPAGFVTNNLADLSRRVTALNSLFAAYTPLKSNAEAAQRAEIQAIESAIHIDDIWQDLVDLLKESRDGMERIRQIVLALRNFARLDEATLQESDINAGLASTLQIVRPLCKDRIAITAEFGELPLVLCNPGELNQVFLNLLLNAMQAIPQSGQIELTSAYRDGRVRVMIRDDGAGMSSSTLARLGEPFFTTKPVGSGTGLGLAVSYGIIARHHGRMWFDSVEGRGTTAWVEIPGSLRQY